MKFDTIYLLTAVGLTPGGSSTVHIYTQTVHRTTQNKQYTEQHKGFWNPYHHPVPLSQNLEILTSWNPVGPPAPVTGLLYILPVPLSKANARV